MTETVAPPASPVTTVAARTVPRLAFGALHLAGPGGWGAPLDRAAAVHLVRGAVDAGIRYIDTADSLGPDVSESVIAEALWPYSDDLLIATKAGMTRTGVHGWGVLGHPAYLRQQAHASALRLRLETIPLFYLHRIDPAYPLEDQLGALVTLRDEGVIENIGLSGVTLAQLHAAQAIVPIAAVQNHYNVVSRASDDVLEATAGFGIPFVTFWSLGRGRDLLENPTVAQIAAELEVPAASLLIAWILQRSATTFPLAGTGSLAHLRGNLAALDLSLPSDAISRLDDLAAHSDSVPALRAR